MSGTGSNLYLTVNGTSLCYDDWGQGILPVLFIHGFPFDKSCWHPQMKALKSDHRVIAYDIRGFGKSSINLDIPDMDRYADDLIRFMDQLGIQKALLCGLSMGGYILLNAVQRFPDRFVAIVLCDTQCMEDTAETKEKRNISIRQVMSGRLAEFADQFMSKLFDPETVTPTSELYSQVKQIILSTPSETITGALNALKNRREMCSSLQHIELPTLIICGEQDMLTPMEKSEALHQGIAGSEIYPIPNAGHLSNLEQPELFNRGLTKFVNKHSRFTLVTEIQNLY
ncbi:MAG: alpha/beta fold hydrolase [Saprospiraceae bacterium]|nr:alpha/beta fold hydrolase [Saprospiraceae bacterium]